MRIQLQKQITEENLQMANEPDSTQVVTSPLIRALKNWVSEYTFTDGDLVRDLNSAIIEINWLSLIIKDLRKRVETQNEQTEGN